MKKTENVTFTNMCMVMNGSKVLVQDKISNEYSGITFPGGHVEKGESFTDSVVREIFEETGLTVSELQLCGIKDWVNDDGSRYMVLLYKTDQFYGELKSSEEGEVFWIELNQLSKKTLAEGMDNMLKIFLEDKFSEYFFSNNNGVWDNILK